MSDMRFVNIGFGNVVNTAKISALTVETIAARMEESDEE